jgi:hypothetical protein
VALASAGGRSDLSAQVATAWRSRARARVDGVRCGRALDRRRRSEDDCRACSAGRRRRALLAACRSACGRARALRCDRGGVAPRRLAGTPGFAVADGARCRLHRRCLPGVAWRARRSRRGVRGDLDRRLGPDDEQSLRLRVHGRRRLGRLAGRARHARPRAADGAARREDAPAGGAVRARAPGGDRRGAPAHRARPPRRDRTLGQRHGRAGRCGRGRLRPGPCRRARADPRGAGDGTRRIDRDQPPARALARRRRRARACPAAAARRSTRPPCPDRGGRPPRRPAYRGNASPATARCRPLRLQDRPGSTYQCAQAQHRCPCRRLGARPDGGFRVVARLPLRQST